MEPDAKAQAMRRLNFVVVATFLANGMILGSVPQYLRSELHANKFQTGFGTTGFFVAALLVRPWSGVLMDRFGRRPFIRWTLLGMAVSTLGFFAAHSVVAITLIRLIQGAIGSLFYVSTLTATTELAPPDKRAGAVAKLSVTVYIGFIVGPLTADLLIHGPGFNFTWSVIVALYVVGFVLAAFLSESRAPGEVRSSTEKKPWFHKASITPGIALFATAICFSTVTAFTPDYVDHIGISRPGWLLATYSAAVLLVRVVSGPLIDRASPYHVAIPGFVLGAGGLTMLATSHSVGVSFVAMFVAGLGSGATFPALISLVVRSVPDADRAVGLASLLMFNDVGQAFAGPSVGRIADGFGWRWVFGVPAIFAVFSAGVLIVARTSSRKHPVDLIA
jgi:MFS family permease